MSVTRTFRMNRQYVNPLEGAAVLAEWDPRDERLVVHSASQIPHILKNALCECLSRQNQVHVIVPDVGGGFGFKCVLIPEEIYISWVAMQVKRPVRWIQDRREHLVAAANAREHHYSVTLHAVATAVLSGEADIVVDSEPTRLSAPISPSPPWRADVTRSIQILRLQSAVAGSSNKQAADRSLSRGGASRHMFCHGTGRRCDGPELAGTLRLRMQNPFPATPCPTRRLPAVSSIAAIIRRRYAAQRSD